MKKNGRKESATEILHLLGWDRPMSKLLRVPQHFLLLSSALGQAETDTVASNYNARERRIR